MRLNESGCCQPWLQTSFPHHLFYGPPRRYIFDLSVCLCMYTNMHVCVLESVPGMLSTSSYSIVYLSVCIGCGYQTSLFHSGCVIAEVRDYRRAVDNSFDTQFVLLRPTMHVSLSVFCCFLLTVKKHAFDSALSETTQMGQYQKGETNLDFTEARDSEWQWHQLGHMQVCTSLQADNHASTPPLSFLQAGRPSCHPTNSIKALKAVLLSKMRQKYLL